MSDLDLFPALVAWRARGTGGRGVIHSVQSIDRPSIIDRNVNVQIGPLVPQTQHSKSATSATCRKEEEFKFAAMRNLNVAQNIYNVIWKLVSRQLEAYQYGYTVSFTALSVEMLINVSMMSGMQGSDRDTTADVPTV